MFLLQAVCEPEIFDIIITKPSVYLYFPNIVMQNSKNHFIAFSNDIFRVFGRICFHWTYLFQWKWKWAQGAFVYILLFIGQIWLWLRETPKYKWLHRKYKLGCWCDEEKKKHWMWWTRGLSQYRWMYLYRDKRFRKGISFCAIHGET